VPELPEVETTRSGIAPHVTGQTVAGVVVRERRLRWPVPKRLPRRVSGKRIVEVGRRGKYLLLSTTAGTVILHLGMSGSLRIVGDAEPPQIHDHVDVCLQNGLRLRLRDPRRFGAVLWTETDPARHALLKHLGPEPFSKEFDGAWLYRRAHKRRVAVKNLIMNSRIVAGVGNIYASEALFLAGVHPARQAGRVSERRYEDLAAAIKRVLAQAIKLGGTTLRDFVNGSGEPGYFGQSLRVYGREDEPCVSCRTPIKIKILGQRASYFCPCCQR